MLVHMLKCTELQHVLHIAFYIRRTTLICKLTLADLDHWKLLVQKVEKQLETLINTYYLYITVIHQVIIYVHLGADLLYLAIDKIVNKIE